MDSIPCARRIRKVIATSELREDPRHADNTGEWQ